MPLFRSLASPWLPWLALHGAALVACAPAPDPRDPDAGPCAVPDAVGVDREAPATDAFDAGPADAPADAPAAAAVVPIGYVDVRAAPYLAAGDGTTDDTAAIQRALDDVGRVASMAGQGFCRIDGTPGHGGLVYLRPGRYLIRSHLQVPCNVTLRGAYAPTTGAFDLATAAAGNAVLLAVEGAGSETGTPFVALANAAAIEGVMIFYPHQTDTNPPVAYPYAIGAIGRHVAVLDVGLVNPFQGIDLAAAPANAQDLVRNVYGQPLRRGIVLDHSLDVGRFESVRLSPIWLPSATSPARVYQLAQGVAIEIARADWQELLDVSLSGYAIGVSLTISPAGCLGNCGGSNALIANLAIDDTDVGLQFTANGGHSGVHVRGYSFANPHGPHRVAILHPAGTAPMVFVSDATISGAITRAVLWEGDGTLALTDATVGAWASSLPAIDVRAGGATVRRGQFAADAGVALAAAAGVRLIAVDNTMRGDRITGTAVASGNVQ